MRAECAKIERRGHRFVALTAVDLLELERLLDEGLDLGPADREAWLAGLPAERAHLEGAVRRMLAAPRQSQDPLAPLTLPRVGEEPSSAHAGERVGPYRLVREIGRGGMGSVWLAERADGSFERQIALKLPRLSWMDGLAASMRRERRIGARLEHPNIARMYDAGVDERERPFIAMEYVEGQPIDTYCIDRGLDVRARVGLFLQVVRAVAYAHARLVIHRDLKPANVLVDPRGVAHLLDFGIASLVDAAVDGATQTLQGSRAYTPAYASPEQILGEPIGVASDVYSLGVVLYELLAGVRPFVARRDTPGATEEAVLQGDAPPASARASRPDAARALRGDLDAILSKALKREPSQRYATADALAADLERHLAGATVVARPDSVWYRLNKAVRRQRLAAGAAAAAVLAVVLGSTATIQALHRSALAADRERVSAQFVSELFRINALPNASGAPGSDEPFFDRSARLIEARFVREPDVQAELYGVVAKIYTDVSAGPLAIDYAARQVALLDRLPEDRPRRARAQVLLADALLKEDRFEQAAEHARRAAALVDHDDDTWYDALALQAWAQIDQGRLREADAVVRSAGPGADSARRHESVGTARLLAARAKLLDLDNRFAESDSAYQRAREAIDRLEGAHSPASVDVRLLIVNHLLAHSRLAQARPQMESLLADLRNLGPTGPIRAAVESAHFWEYCYQMGGCSRSETLDGLQASVAAVNARGVVVPEILRARIEVSLGEFYLDLGDVHNAKHWLDLGLPALEAASDAPETKDRVAWVHSVLAQDVGDSGAAVTDLRKVLELLRRRGQAESPRASIVWYYMALSAAIADGPAAAERLLDSAPRFPTDPADASQGNLSPQLVALARARIRLESGDIGGALKIMPGRDLEASVSNYIAMLYIVPLRAELLCKSGSAGEGLQMFRAYMTQVAQVLQAPDFDPDVIRERGAMGLCALSANDRGLAVDSARQARAALEAQPEIGAYYARNLLALEQALTAKSAPGRQWPNTAAAHREG
jgi:serine/threonine protein kinase